MATNIASLRVKSNAKWVCQECGSTEFIQGHHQVPKDDSTIIPLCADCHSKKHPGVPRGLFFVKNHQPYWENGSASSIAHDVGVHPRTIIRRARNLGIPKGILSAEDREQLYNRILSLTDSTRNSNAQKLRILVCKRCKYDWASRQEKPIICPKCKSPYWNKERKTGTGDGK